MIKCKFLKSLLPVSIFLTGFCFSQNDNLFWEADLLYQGEKYISNKKIECALLEIQALDTLKLTPNFLARYYMIRGNAMLSLNIHDQAYISMKRAYFLYDSLNDPFKKNNVSIKLLSVLRRQSPYEKSIERIVKEINKLIDNYCKYSFSCSGYLEVTECYKERAIRSLHLNQAGKAKENFNSAIEYAGKNDDTLRIITNSFNKAILYKTILKDLDSSIFFYKKLEPLILNSGNNNFIAANYNNQAEIHFDKGDLKTALKFYEKANSIELNNDALQTKWIILGRLVRVHEKLGNWEKAYKIRKERDTIGDLIDESEQNIAILRNQIKYETLEKDKTILEQDKNLLIKEKQTTQNRNIALGLGGGLAAVSIFAFLVYKNTRRKQRIAEQEKELEIQKKEKILKDQELNAIDAMIEGQEKERQRLASDLHDSVGATLSAAKLQFDHIAKNRDKLVELEELFEKTGSLLEEAYTEVRSMAHLKNSGVIASKGLLPAVEKLAKNASNNNGLTIEVQDFGLTEKLEASLEIAIFRMIQELITNIIKHAGATEAHISITQHEDTLNIIVEDNGKGFNPRKMKKAEGMGLHSIEKRVEHLEGSLEMDSTPGRGTNIIIDIPL